MRSRSLTQAAVAAPSSAFADDVRAGLGRQGQKTLPSRYFYDEVGSALFEAITVLPEYGLTAADERLLERYADSIVARLARPITVVELGSGSGTKTRWVLEAVCRRHPAIYHPVELSPSALARCVRELHSIDSLTIVGHEQSYLKGLAAVAAGRRKGDHLAVLFLGSNIGNFDRAEADRFLRQVRHALRPGDALLLGTDLIKPVALMLRAYDDAAGVTAAFNLNLLARINRELGADFDLSRFRHSVRYDRSKRRIEMHLRSTADQVVTIPGAGMKTRLRRGETIWTESSHKYEVDVIPELARRTGFICEAQWVDSEWPFAESLLIAR